MISIHRRVNPTLSVLCHGFSIHHCANPTLSRLPCVNPFCPINTHFRNDLIKQQIYLPLAFGQVPGFRRPSSSSTLERNSQDAGIGRNTVSGVRDLCLTYDLFPLTYVSTHKNSEIDRKPDSHLGQGNRTLHFAAGFVKSSVVPPSIQVPEYISVLWNTSYSVVRVHALCFKIKWLECIPEGLCLVFSLATLSSSVLFRGLSSFISNRI